MYSTLYGLFIDTFPFPIHLFWLFFHVQHPSYKYTSLKINLLCPCQYLLLSQPVPGLQPAEVALSVSADVQTSSQAILSNTHKVAVKGMGVLQNSLPRLLRMKSPTHRSTHLLMLTNGFAKKQSAYNLKGLSAVWKHSGLCYHTTHIPHGN